MCAPAHCSIRKFRPGANRRPGRITSLKGPRLGSIERHYEMEAASFAAVEDGRPVVMNDSKKIAGVQRQSFIATSHMGASGGFANKVIADQRRVLATPSFNCNLVGLNFKETDVENAAPIHLDDRVDKIQAPHREAIHDPPLCAQEGAAP